MIKGRGRAMRYRFLAIAVLASSLTEHSVRAVPVPMADVPAMTQAADLIVVGRASQTQNANAPFLVTVDRVLKGSKFTTRNGSLSSQIRWTKATPRSTTNRIRDLFLETASAGQHLYSDGIRSTRSYPPRRGRRRKPRVAARWRVSLPNWPGY